MIALVDVYDSTSLTGIRKHATDFLYEIMREREQEPEINISHKGLPTMAQHMGFITGRPYRYWYLVEADDQSPFGPRHPLWVGYISATANNEIGIVLQQYVRGKGIGPQAIKQFIATHSPNPASPSVRNGQWLANVNPNNKRSVAMFAKLGFQCIQHTYALPEEEPHGQETSRT